MLVVKGGDTGLKVTAAGAFALDVVVNFEEWSDGGRKETGRKVTMMTTATTTVVLAPALDPTVERRITSMSLYASAAGSQTATVSLDDGTSVPKLAIATLTVDQSYRYEEGRGWQKFLNTGAEAAAA